MSLLGRLFGTMLPDVWAQDLSASGEDDMGTSMMSLKLLTATLINVDADLLTLEHLDVTFKRSVKVVKNGLANLFGIDDLICASTSLNFQ